MRKLALVAGVVALATTTPALADGRGKGVSHSPPGQSQASLGFHGTFAQLVKSMWRPAFFTPPGFSSPGRHFGWFRGKHWGWFKPKNPHWPHEPPVSP